MKHTMAKLVDAGVRVADIDISGELGTPENATDWYLGLLGKIIRVLRLDINIASWWTQATGETANQRLMRFFAQAVFAHGFAASVKTNAAIPQTISNTYLAHHYDLLQLTLKGHTESVISVCFSLDDTKVVTGAWDNTVRIWSLDSGEVLHTFQVNQVRLVANQPIVITVIDNATLAWDINSGTQLWRLPGRGYSVAIGKHQNKLIRQAHNEQSIRITINAIKDGSEIASFSVDTGQSRVISMLELIANDKQFIMAFAGGYIEIRGIKTTKPSHTLDLSHLPGVGIFRANLAADEQRLVTGQQDGTARVWDLALLRQRASNPTRNPLANQTPQQLWLKVQRQLGLTLDENDQVVPLYPDGPRQLSGWTDELEQQLQQFQ